MPSELRHFRILNTTLMTAKLLTHTRLRNPTLTSKSKSPTESYRIGLAAQVSGEAPVFDIVFTDRPVVDYRATLTADRARIRAFNEACVRRGVVKAVNKIYVSLAHTDADVDATLAVFDEALAEVARGA